MKAFLFLFVFLIKGNSISAQEKSIYSVAIFLYQNVELLDFAGPTEVFSSTTGFRVYTVSVDGKDILSQGLLTVKPQYSIDNAPTPDIIVFPGGNSGPSSRDPKVIKWAQTVSASGATVMSVCTGAFILARAEMLNNLSITTHHASIESLKKTVPSAEVLEHTRFVDNGNILTTAGVSAGIDGALHMVARIKGVEVAKATAHYMEYDKWNPDDGKTAFLNPYLQQKGTIPKETPIPFEGEIADASLRMYDKGLYPQAASLLENGITWYPNSGNLYNLLGRTYLKLGKPAPIDESSFMKLIDAGNFDEAVAVFEKNQKSFPGWKIFAESTMNDKGYELLRNENLPGALKALELNTRAYPKSGNAWDSLAEANMNAGNKKEAIMQYKKSLELDPGNTNAVKMLEKLEMK